ncbi:MAG: NCS2 family permease [Kouleothrix sp.]|jgi:AGZA family xanthine/uracil permease-like MFS transporter|nr:NCS2 family permease [Kouleothrix sp.]
MITTNNALRTSQRSLAAQISQHFQVAERRSSLRTEIVGGLTTFAVMAYIIFLNPLVLTLNGAGQAPQVASFAGLATATCLSAALLTLAMGWYTNYPFALAPSVGISTVLAADLIATHALSWQATMGLLLVGGLLVTALVALGLGDALVRAIPIGLKRAVGVGIGLLLLYIGMLNAGIVQVQPGQLGATRLPVSLGSLTALPTALALLGLLATLGLMLRGYKAALLYGILLTTAVAIGVKWLLPEAVVSRTSGVADLRNFVALPLDTSTIGAGLTLEAFNSPAAAAKGLGMTAALLVMVTLMLSSFLDTVGTIVGVGEQAGLVDAQGELPQAKRVLVIDSLATACGGLFGVSALTTYIESAAGVAAGARTGLSALVTGICFLLALGVTPFVGLIPPEATAPALIVVGFLMFQTVRDIDFGELGAGFAALLTLVLIPLTCSITNGIGVGVIVYVLLSALGGRARTVPALLWLLAAAFVGYFVMLMV